MTALKNAILLASSYFFAQHINACEISNIQQLPVELILNIVRTTVNQDAKSPKEVFGNAIAFLSTNKQLNAIKQLLLNSKKFIELRNQVEWELVQKKMKDYEDNIENILKNPEHPEHVKYLYSNKHLPGENALHKAALLDDKSFLSYTLPLLFRLKKTDIINHVVTRSSDNASITPLRKACMSLNLECVKLLLANGANANIITGKDERLAGSFSTYRRLSSNRVVLFDVEKALFDIWDSRHTKTKECCLAIIKLLVPVTKPEYVKQLIATIKRRSGDRWDSEEQYVLARYIEHILPYLQQTNA